MSETSRPAVLVTAANHVMTIIINRPEARNAVNCDVHVGVGAALDAADSDPEIRAVILTGAGDQAFSAGADLKALANGESISPDDPGQRAWGFAGFASHHISKPTIAAINGFALGGGTELALAADLAVAADTALFGLPEVKRGILAGAGGAFRLGLQVQGKAAMEILLTGDPITAARALELGLVNQIVPRDHLMDAALELAARITTNAPLAVQASKRIARGIVLGRIETESRCWAQTKAESGLLKLSEDAREGPRAFAEKRAPVWKGR